VRRYEPLGGALRGAIPPEPAFLLRTLLIHDYRKLLLRDPELPDDLLPADWRGREARELCADLYRRVASPSEAYLGSMLQTADGARPPLSREFEMRFGGLAIPSRR
jgi:phenylacetic acid degradation operon negative regulatory protein